jgi:hypothetical protein
MKLVGSPMHGRHFHELTSIGTSSLAIMSNHAGIRHYIDAASKMINVREGPACLLCPSKFILLNRFLPIPFSKHALFSPRIGRLLPSVYSPMPTPSTLLQVRNHILSYRSFSVLSSSIYVTPHPPSPSVGPDTYTHSTLLTLSSSLRVKGLTGGWYGW